MSIYINHSTNDISTNAGAKPTLGGVIVREQSEKIAGDIVQRVITSTSAVATGTTTIPDDDTIPQNTEGTEFITVTITPTNTNNKLYIRTILNCSLSTGPTGLGVALFQDATANAIAATSITQVAANYQVQAEVVHSMTAGTTSATTFKVRAGGASASTLTLNGYGGARRYGGVLYSFIEVTEVKV